MGLTSSFRDYERPVTEGISEMKTDSSASIMVVKDQKSPLKLDNKETSNKSARKLGQSGSLLPVLFPEKSSSVASASVASVMSMSEFDWCASKNNIFDNKGKTREEIGKLRLKAMLSCGASVKNFTTHGKRSALMFAVLCEDLELVKSLITAGANVKDKDEDGETAIGLAKSLPSQEIYNFLLKYDT